MNGLKKMWNDARLWVGGDHGIAPVCIDSNPSPQQRAENDCDRCPFDTKCSVPEDKLIGDLIKFGRPR